jgi:hypothetical protein
MGVLATEVNIIIINSLTGAPLPCYATPEFMLIVSLESDARGSRCVHL